MDQSIIIKLLITFIFLAISLYNLRIRSECLHLAKLTRAIRIVVALGIFVFLAIAYLFGKHWLDYLVALSGGLLLVSSQISQGIHAKGIYYLLGKGLCLRLVPWNCIKDLDIDYQNNHLKALADRSKIVTIYPDQYYSDLAIAEIEGRIIGDNYENNDN